jgi:putative transposase
MISSLPANGVGVMNRGFAGLDFIKQMNDENKYFVLRICNSWKLEFNEKTALLRVGTTKKSGLYRVINFCDIDTKKEYRLVTNLPSQGKAEVNNNDILEIYRCRWGVELL